jgi:hypothetical protein
MGYLKLMIVGLLSTKKNIGAASIQTNHDTIFPQGKPLSKHLSTNILFFIHFSTPSDVFLND